jgi:hypothetical protein
MNKTFNRRILLRGLGGAAVAAPFLPSVMEREAKAQGMTAAAPKRLIVFFTYHGCLTNRWFPAKSHGTLSTAEYMALPTLAPVAPYAPKLLMPRGIRSMNEWSFEGTNGQKNDPHTNPAGSMFTAFPLTPNSTTSSASNPGKFDAKPTGRSLDHIAASAVNKTSSGQPASAATPGAAPLFMQMGGVQGSPTNNMNVISWSDDKGTIFAGVGSPTTVYSSLTNLFTAGQPTNADTYAVARGKSVIDCVRDDLNRLNGINMSASDKSRLKTWTELLHYVGGGGGGMVGAQCSMASATTLGLTGTLTGGNITKTANTFMDLAVLTALCDSNRVIFMKLPANANLSSVVQYAAADGSMKNVGTDAHSVSHRIGNAGMGGQCVADAIAQIHAIDKYYATQFAYLVGRLDSFSEGDGKLLDNTATVWFQEMSDGNSHNLNNMPILQAGSCGGYFKTGQAINVEGAKADMSQGNSDKDCANGQTPFGSLDGVGTPATVANMPINKYYCNLLNAIGAKADATGYAVPGGTMPVTKFGKYDDTKLFADGGTAASNIKNPGEYADLKA